MCNHDIVLGGTAELVVMKWSIGETFKLCLYPDSTCSEPKYVEEVLVNIELRYFDEPGPRSIFITEAGRSCKNPPGPPTDFVSSVPASGGGPIP